MRRTAGRGGAIISAVALALVVTPAGADPTTESSPAPTETSLPPSATPTTEPTANSSGNSPAEKTAPAQPDQPRVAAATDLPSLEVTAEFDKPAYRTDDLVNVKFRIKNVGTGPAGGVRVDTKELEPTEIAFDRGQWGDMAVGTPGRTIDPGTTLETTLSGRLNQLDADAVTLTGHVFATGPFLLSVDFAFSALLTKVYGHAAGIVFDDKNANGSLDPDEELADVPVSLRYTQRPTEQQVTATSDKAGRFTFPKVLVADYFIGGETIDGKLFPQATIHIDESNNNGELRLRGTSPLNGALHATIKFAKDSYTPGELAHLTAALSNSGSTPLIGVVVRCNRHAQVNSLNGAGSGWSPLNTQSGVTIDPGQTRTFDISEKVPEAAINTGFVDATCDFGYREVDIDNHAQVAAFALVPGASATVAGHVFEFASHPTGISPQGGGPLAGVRIVLVGPQSCPVISESTTGADGVFQFTEVPAGRDYKLFAFPPAGRKMSGANPLTFGVVAPKTDVDLQATRGEAQPPTLPTPPSSCTPTPTPEPAPQGRSSSGLANTGASVIGLAGLGALALLMGAGAVVATRRRRNTEA